MNLPTRRWLMTTAVAVALVGCVGVPPLTFGREGHADPGLLAALRTSAESQGAAIVDVDAAAGRMRIRLSQAEREYEVHLYREGWIRVVPAAIHLSAETGRYEFHSGSARAEYERLAVSLREAAERYYGDHP